MHWSSHTWLGDAPREVLDTVDDFLYGNSDFTIRLTVNSPGPRPTIADLATELYSINKRVKLACLLTVEDKRFFDDKDSFLFLDFSRYASLSLRLRDISVGSLHAEFEGSADEIRRLIKADLTPSFRTMRKRVIAAFIVVFLAGVATEKIVVNNHPASLPTQVSREMQDAIRNVCDPLPSGTEVTVKLGMVEVKMPCPPTDTAKL